MMQIELDTSKTAEAIRRAEDSLEDMTPLFQSVAEYMIKASRERFNTGTAPDGSRWAPKAASTLERYRKRGYGLRPKPLVGPSGRLGSEILGLPSRYGAVIGSALIYSGVMQNGAEKGAFGSGANGRLIPWGRIPARTWLGLSAADEQAIIASADEYVARPLGGAD